MTAENKAGESRAEVKAKRDVQFWLDVMMKLTVPLGAIVAAWLANHFEQNRANLQLINQREQAESSLRATMFGQLIAPIAGPRGSDADSDPVRYAVLAQLLTLNFHEHFELRPLLQDADDRLSKYQGPVAPQAILAARIDRLSERSKEVLQTAAVIGKAFGEGLLREVAASVMAIGESELGAALSTLVAAEFVYDPAAPWEALRSGAVDDRPGTGGGTRSGAGRRTEASGAASGRPPALCHQRARFDDRGRGL